MPFEFIFNDVNPCTGGMHTVTITGTTYVHDHNSRVVATSDRTITTSPTGLVGHGTDKNVVNGQVEMFRLTDILTNASGDRIRAHFVLVVDLSTGTVRARRCRRPVWGRLDDPDPRPPTEDPPAINRPVTNGVETHQLPISRKT